MSRAVNRRIFLAGAAAASLGLLGEPAVAAAAPGPGAGAAAANAPKPVSRRPLRIPDVSVRNAARNDPTEATIAEAVTLIRNRRLTAAELIEAQLDRISRFDDTYLAFNSVTAAAARSRARAIDRLPREHRPALSGVGLCIKDNYFTAGVPTTANSFIFQDFVPDFDATSVARLAAAGGIMLGKGQMGPLATTRATKPNGEITTVNAWTPADPSVDPGGSSTGPATAVAGRMATSSIGTQTGGSIVLPSNQQNLTGLKPTMGRTSVHGVIPLSYTRDHSGPLARDALDAAIMLTVMAGPDAADPRTLGLPDVPALITSALPVRRKGRTVLRRRTKIGVPPDYLSVTGPALAIRSAFLDQLSSIGDAELVEVGYPDDWDLLTGTFNAIRLSERTEPFLDYLKSDPQLFGVSLLSWLQGVLLSGDEWITGQRAKNHLLREVLDGMLTQADVVLQTGPVAFDILGLPEIGFPIGFASDGTTGPVGTPVGTILGGAPYEEDRLLEVVAAYQAVTDWHTTRPADPVLPDSAGQPRSRSALSTASRLTPEEALAASN
ncbi:amidase [Nakamurella lactea]|uniref:amidase n=1 Tax=Nakamurella lactea TaxID=459515 RepID=UPI00042604AF|nr:amidase [Nakamurella lactea]